MTLVVSFKKSPGGFEFYVVSNAGEDVQKFPLGSAGVTHTVRCKKRQTQRLGEPNGSLIPSLFERIAVPLYFDIDIFFSEKGFQLFNILTRFVVTVVRKRSRQHTFLAARQTHQSLGVFRDLIQCGRSSSFFLFAQLVARHETA